jgi:hypothetical protein
MRGGAVTAAQTPTCSTSLPAHIRRHLRVEGLCLSVHAAQLATGVVAREALQVWSQRAGEDLAPQLYTGLRGAVASLLGAPGSLQFPAFASIADLYAGLADTYELPPLEGVSEPERLALHALEQRFDRYRLAHIVGVPAADIWPRRLLVGRSDVARAWTDGRGFIAFDRAFLRPHLAHLSGWLHLVRVLCHEYAHEGEECREHGDAFYERFHEFLPGFLDGVVPAYQAFARHLMRKHAGALHVARRELRALVASGDLDLALDLTPDPFDATASSAPDLDAR